MLLDADTGRSRAFAFALPATGSDDDKFRRLRDAPDSPLVTLACARTLPAGAEVKLVWGKGIAAASGVATAADQALAFEVRPAFRASFSCERVNRNAQCLPLLPLTLVVHGAGAAQATRRRSGSSMPRARRTRRSCRRRSDGDGVDAVTFGPGLPEKQTLPPRDSRGPQGRRRPAARQRRDRFR